MNRALEIVAAYWVALFLVPGSALAQERFGLGFSARPSTVEAARAPRAAASAWTRFALEPGDTPPPSPREDDSEPAESGGAEAAPEHGPTKHGAAEAGADPNTFRFTTLRAWYFVDFLPEGDYSDVLGIESNSAWGWGDFDVTNISYIELAQFPQPIPGRPVGNPGDPTEVEGATGITDLLTAFLFSKKRTTHGRHHFSYGLASQFPTATDDTLGSGKWSLGPAVEYAYDADRFFAAFVALQLWSVAGDEDRKDVSMMMVKPMVTYRFADDWKLVYMPYGISVYWNKADGERVYLPVGGGIQYDFEVGGLSMGASVQFFNYVLRPTDGSENDLRFMLEFNF